LSRVAADTNAVIDFTRGERVSPPQLQDNDEVVLPLPVLSELFAGAHMSEQIDRNLASVDYLLFAWSVVTPDLETARVYGALRARLRQSDLRQSKVNDLWIAALCIQHNLPLLTNDRGFDSIAELTVIHW
jgi:tRNA(fMet)-specific endonuclease VapC